MQAAQTGLLHTGCELHSTLARPCIQNVTTLKSGGGESQVSLIELGW